MLDTSTWKEFTVNYVFDILNGKGITTTEINEHPGDFIAVQSSESKNGCMGFIDKDYCDDMNYTMSELPCLTVARTGSVAFVSYQKHGCVVGDSAKILLLKKRKYINDNVMLFLKSILVKLRERYHFARKVTEDIYGNDFIKLPVNEDGEPDYKFMEDYIANADGDVSSIPDYFLDEGYDKACWYLDNIDVEKFENEYAGKKEEHQIKLSDREWKEFRIGGGGGLFECILPNYDLKISEIYFGDVNLITTTKNDNGWGGYVADGSCDTSAFSGNKITVNMFGYAFYQEKDFYTVGHGHVNILTPNFPMNKYVGLFICSMVNNDLYRFSFGRAVYQGIIEDLMINLPIQLNDDGTPFIDETHKYSEDGYVPDWQFMEDYIKSLPFSCKL